MHEDRRPETRSFRVTGVKPGFNQHEENGVSAFEEVTEKSFPGKWKVIYFYPKDFTFVCPTEIVGFARLADDFEDRDAVLLAGSTDNEFVKLAWRRDHKDLDRLNHWMFADTTGALVDKLGIRDPKEGGRCGRPSSSTRTTSSSTSRSTT